MLTEYIKSIIYKNHLFKCSNLIHKKNIYFIKNTKNSESDIQSKINILKNKTKQNYNYQLNKYYNKKHLNNK